MFDCQGVYSQNINFNGDMVNFGVPDFQSIRYFPKLMFGRHYLGVQPSW